VTLLVVGVLATVLVVGSVVVALRLRSNITVVDVSDALTEGSVTPPRTEPAASSVPEDEPEQPSQPVNILVMGSDTREGQGDAYGSAAVIEGARSDTTLLVHLAADRRSVTVVSIPRDLVVTLPECTMPDGSRTSAYQDRFNAAFSIGGPECTIRTVSALTGLPLQHFVVVDFTAFQAAIDALGGVEVCLTEAVDDPKAGLSLPAGVSRVGGEQALAFVRARETLGDGSDLARIERQQAFLGSLVRESRSRDLLTDPVRLVRSLDAATRSVTTDEGLAWLPRTVSIARSLAGIEPAAVSFTTLPYVANDDQLTVSVDQPRLDLLVAVLAEDVPWPFADSSADPVAVAPDQVSVAVVNASGRSGQATLVATALREQGFAVPGLDDAATQPETRVLYPEGAEDQAATVAAAVDGAVLVPDSSVGTVTLQIGESFSLRMLRTVVVAVPATEPPSDGWVAPDTSLPTGGTTTADTGTCAS